MFPKITVPTRSSKSSASLIDQMSCKLKDPKQHLLSCLIKSSLSDHFAYLSVFDIFKKVKQRPEFLKINCSDENSFRAFYDEVHPCLLNSNMNLDLFCDPNENYKQFEGIILSAKAKHLAPKMIKHKNKKNINSRNE